MFATIEASAPAAFTLQDVQQLLYREARALDDRDWDAWLALYTPDAEFWVPSWDDNDRPAGLHGRQMRRRTWLRQPDRST
jgi:benzoate/toluate 1,2-dioxygenase beta subunit